jgi:hypothetical protein
MNAPVPTLERAASPFDLDDEATYRRWRDWKLALRATRIDDLIVDVADLRVLTPAEHSALLARIASANMALYRSPPAAQDKDLPRLLGAQLGLRRLDANWLADEDGVSLITVSQASDSRGSFIPYTDRPSAGTRWHYHPQ